MQDYSNFLLILSMIILIFLYDIFYDDANQCILKNTKNKISIILITLLHQVISVFATFGWIFKSKYILKIYVLVNIIIFLHWRTNKDRCAISQQYNKLCNYKDCKKFNDIFNMIGFRKYDVFDKIIYPFYIVLTFSLAVIDLSQ